MKMLHDANTVNSDEVEEVRVVGAYNDNDTVTYTSQVKGTFNDDGISAQEETETKSQYDMTLGATSETFALQQALAFPEEGKQYPDDLDSKDRLPDQPPRKEEEKYVEEPNVGQLDEEEDEESIPIQAKEISDPSDEPLTTSGNVNSVVAASHKNQEIMGLTMEQEQVPDIVSTSQGSSYVGSTEASDSDSETDSDDKVANAIVVPLTPEEMIETQQTTTNEKGKAKEKDEAQSNGATQSTLAGNGLLIPTETDMDKPNTTTHSLQPKRNEGDGHASTDCDIPSTCGSSALPEATPFESTLVLPNHAIDHDEPADLEAGASEKDKAKERKGSCICVRELLVIAVGVAIVVLLTLTYATPKAEPKDVPTLAPLTPSKVPTFAPSTTPLPHAHPLDALLKNLPASTVQNINNMSTPQWQAFEWLSNHQSVDNLEEWRKQQIFALGTFFYSFEGPSWPDQLRNRWMNASANECQWLVGTEFQKSITSQRPDHLQSVSYNNTPCNKEGEIESLALSQLGLARHKPFVPAEIALLTSLSTLALPNNQILASMDDMIPTELFLMTNLSVLNLERNALFGKIPSQLGLTKLSVLLLGKNYPLTSTIPTELGQLSNSLTTLGLDSSHIYGFIPRELRTLTSLNYLDLHETLLVGPLRSEIGTLQKLEELDLHNTFLSGTIPLELQGLSTNLSLFSVVGTYLDGTVPPDLCNISTLEFDCSTELCGCYCPCIQSTSKKARKEGL